MMFRLEVHENGRLAGELILDLGKPTLHPTVQMWECEIGWAGLANGHVRAYGASSFQSLQLALDLAVAELRSIYPSSIISESGRPWPEGALAP